MADHLRRLLHDAIDLDAAALDALALELARLGYGVSHGLAWAVARGDVPVVRAAGESRLRHGDTLPSEPCWWRGGTGAYESRWGARAPLLYASQSAAARQAARLHSATRHFTYGARPAEATARPVMLRLVVVADAGGRR